MPGIQGKKWADPGRSREASGALMPQLGVYSGWIATRFLSRNRKMLATFERKYASALVVFL